MTLFVTITAWRISVTNSHNIFLPAIIDSNGRERQDCDVITIFINLWSKMYISSWLLLLSCKVWLLLMGWPMACDPSRPMSQWSRVLVTSPRGQMASILFRQEPHSMYNLQLVRATIECFLLGLNNLSSGSVSALLYSITRGKNVWSCHGGNDSPQRETIPCRTYNISHS